MATANNLPLPAPLKLSSGNIATDWKRFLSQWRNYEIAADLSDKSTQRRAATFLACVGTEAFERFQSMEFDTDDDRQDIDKVIDAFNKYCIGETNVTYERYVLNRRLQSSGESFDVFLADIRRLIRSCNYNDLEDSIVRDRIVIGIQNDATRRKLLQVRRLDLNTAIDICKASEAAAIQLQEISSKSEEINRIDNKQRRQQSSTPRDKRKSVI